MFLMFSSDLDLANMTDMGNSILHQRALWYEDKMVYQWLPHDLLGYKFKVC